MVYAAGLLAFLALVIAAIVTARGRLLAVAAGVAVASLVIPFVISVATFDEFMVAWQGRYTLPLSVGIPLLLALALDSRVTARTTALATVGAVLVLGLTHAVSVANVTASERTTARWSGPDTG